MVAIAKQPSIIAALVVCALAHTSAQSPIVSYTVTIWGMGPGGLTNTSPAAPSVIYASANVPCGQPKLPQSAPPLVNVTEGRLDDPANKTLDCVINLAKQVADLPAGNYRIGWRADGATGSSPYGELSDPFERRLGAPDQPSRPRLR